MSRKIGALVLSILLYVLFIRTTPLMNQSGICQSTLPVSPTGWNRPWNGWGPGLTAGHGAAGSHSLQWSCFSRHVRYGMCQGWACGGWGLRGPQGTAGGHAWWPESTAEQSDSHQRQCAGTGGQRSVRGHTQVRQRSEGSDRGRSWDL